jgi:integrase
MNFVEPIRDKKQIAHIKNLLRGQKRFRDLLLFVVGINNALRISDLLALRVGDFIDETGAVRKRFPIREKKRGKRQDVVVNDSVGEALQSYLAAYPGVVDKPEHYVFFSTTAKGETPLFDVSLKRAQAWKLIAAVCKDAGLRGNFGTHTMRKTWGYHARMNGVGLEVIMAKLNHSNIVTTKRYLGITDDELQAAVEKLNL